MNGDTVSRILGDLTGQVTPFPRDVEAAAIALLNGNGLGCSQVNELLLLLGYDRISTGFFQFLLDGTTDYGNSAFKSLIELRNGVDRFRKVAALRFGSVKFGFKYLSSPATNLQEELALLEPVSVETFQQRHDALIPIELIPGDKTYYLGYLVKGELDQRLKLDPHDADAKSQLAERESIVATGIKNHEAYLVSDHMDVYVATSMRERHEYQMVGRIVQDVFNQPELKKLKPRWFDPTQAYCADRIDKGLAEALMLKRAACTLYLAQESDTLGKDSELACTLAQGKPVIAFVPQVSPAEQDTYIDDLLKMVAQGNLSKKLQQVILDQLRVFKPDAAWSDTDVQRWIADPNSMNVVDAKRKLGNWVREHYDKRAKTLKESHPLGIQVHLETGVANGVLVARSPQECAELIRRILTRTLEFTLAETKIDEKPYLLLKEGITGSIFRVVTGDRFLTNAFWNFYLVK